MLLPTSNPYVSGEASIFDTLVKAGEEESSVTLPFQLRTFLVRCLIEHLRDPEIVHHVLTISFLRSAEKFGEEGNVLLKRAGDEALLLAGLFPERALRLHVSSTYFRFMGQAAYASLAVKFQATGRRELGRFYDEVTEHFRLLEEVLNAARARPETTWGAFRRLRVSLE